MAALKHFGLHSMTYPPGSASPSWLLYRCHQIIVFDGPQCHAGLLRYQGKFIAYCEANASEQAREYLCHLADERLRGGMEQALADFSPVTLHEAAFFAYQQLDNRGKRLFRLHQLSHDGAVPLETALRWSGYDSSVDMLLCYARFGRLIYDAIQCIPKPCSSQREPYLASIIQAHTTTGENAVSRLKPEVYCALQPASDRQLNHHGYRASQDFPRS